MNGFAMLLGLIILLPLLALGVISQMPSLTGVIIGVSAAIFVV